MKNVKMTRKITIMSMILFLVCAISVTFAWYTSIQVNNGTLEIPVDTQVQEGIVLAFTPFSELEGILAPAQMKQGVINNHLVSNSDGSYTSGLLEKLDLPYGEAALPKLNEVKDALGTLLYYTYSTNPDDFGNLVSGNQYLEYPATMLYRQFELSVGSLIATTKNASFSIGIQYLSQEGKFVDMKQTDAVSINFYLVDSTFSNADLSSISTDRYESDLNKGKTWKTFSQLMYDNSNVYKIYELTRSGKDYTIKDTPEVYNILKNKTPDGGKGYNIIPEYKIYADGTFTLDFNLKNMIVNQEYHLLINIYYNLPDELLDGGLLVTNKIVLNIRYNLS